MKWNVIRLLGILIIMTSCTALAESGGAGLPGGGIHIDTPCQVANVCTDKK